MSKPCENCEAERSIAETYCMDARGHCPDCNKPLAPKIKGIFLRVSTNRTTLIEFRADKFPGDKFDQIWESIGDNMADAIRKSLREGVDPPPYEIQLRSIR